MREVKKDTTLTDMFFMADSGDLWTAVTSLTFANSGDIQASKNGGSFTDISGDASITERGFGFYSITTSHMDTVGKAIIHAEGAAAVPADLILSVVDNIEKDSFDAISSVDVRVSSIGIDVSSYDQFKADLTPFLSGIAAGTIINPTATVEDDDPAIAYQKTNYNPLVFVSLQFSSFVSSYDWYFTVKERVRDAAVLWTVQGTISNADSMSFISSHDPTSHTNQLASDFYFYEVQVRTRDTVLPVHNAVVGNLQLKPTLKL